MPGWKGSAIGNPPVIGGHRVRSASHWYVLCVTAALFTLTAALIMLSPGKLGAQEFDDEPPEYLHGLVATYRGANSGFQQVVPQPYYDAQVPEWLPPDIAASPIQRIQWDGLLHIRDKGPLKFFVYAAGSFSLSVDDHEVLTGSSDTPKWFESTAVDVRFGRRQFQLQYVPAPGVAGHIRVFWAGPSFMREPISANYFWHEYESTVPDDSGEALALVHGLRCAACHEIPLAEPTIAAPDLTRVRDNLHPQWIVEHLLAQPEGTDASQVGGTLQARLARRRMPFFDLTEQEATAIAAALWAASEPGEPPPDVRREIKTINASRKKQDQKLRSEPDPDAGRVLFHSVGCIACHSTPDLSPDNRDLKEVLFGGGDLSAVARKRTQNFFARWLSDPALVNRDHRMPRFELSPVERLDLQAYLVALGNREAHGGALQPHETARWWDQTGNPTQDYLERGKRLLQQYRCGNCHRLPASLAIAAPQSRIRLRDIVSDGGVGCLGAPDRRRAMPGYDLLPDQQEAILALLRRGQEVAPKPREQKTAVAILSENNCLACHARGTHEGIAQLLPKIATAIPETAAELAGLAPPSLQGVGDKLTDEALARAIRRTGPPLRPWLRIQMPHFNLTEADVEALVKYFVRRDRMPDYPRPEVSLPQGREVELAANRLVTADGFGCQSCHQIGSSEPPQVDLKARGTNLTLLGERIRKPWFDRWVRNPSRIIPRMEMPAIQTPVPGVLEGRLELQLETLWSVLNRPGFEPPKPNPVRVVRTHNLPELDECAQLVTGVIEVGDADQTMFVWPLAIGVPNRNNVLFDLEQGNLAAWWIGDLARQQTRGKTWYWEPGNPFLNSTVLETYELQGDKQRWQARRDRQTAVRLDAFGHREDGFWWRGRLHFAGTKDAGHRYCPIEQYVAPGDVGQNAVRVQTSLRLPAGYKLRLRIGGQLVSADRKAGNVVFRIAQDAVVRVRPDPSLRWEIDDAGVITLSLHDAEQRSVEWVSEYRSELPSDSFPRVERPREPARPVSLPVVPGYEAIQLPLPRAEMPISFAWSPKNEMFMGSLKGRVFRVVDRDADGLYDDYEPISDNVPTPYGLWAGDGYVDALAKFALLRLTPNAHCSEWDATVVADGWGYTNDYHDWAVGLERDERGNYYATLPCQQDDRRPDQAYLRGHAIKLIPVEGSAEQHRRYRIESICAGLRFPMGLVRTREGELFATDNQGNYNPFNELNHLLPGKRYGFINKLENKPGFAPPAESPAICLPHPWTRSVNGVCQLIDPTVSDPRASRFGPFEGHLIGCEMNGRALIRMSLQRVGDTYQGAAYRFSRLPREGEQTFEGPIVCEVAPNGDLYVGNLQDSGWGGGSNTGSIVRLRPTGPLPVGVAEVIAVADGFSIRFTQPVDPELAARPGAYQIRSYRRISTPAYGGDDQDERMEKILAVQVSEDGREVKLQLPPWREGFVYEINIAPIGPSGCELFPSEAHYTLRVAPN